MSSYDEQLARQILSALDEIFPKPTYSDTLKESAQFKQVPQQDWILALDALLHLGHIEGRDIRTGYHKALQGILDCRITPSGREHVRPAITWKSFYREWLARFGKEFFEKRKGKLLSAAVGAMTTFLAGHSSEAWINWRNTAIGTLLGVGAWTLSDFVRVPWLMHKEPANREQQVQRIGFTILGVAVVLALVIGIGFLTTPLWLPQRHRHVILMNDEYANLTNAQHAFKSLSVQVPNCILRITAPPENRQVVDVLRNVAGDFCKLEQEPDRNNADIDVLSGSETDAIVIHLTKSVSTKDEVRDGVLHDLSNFLSIRLKHDMPVGSPPELIWLQVGRGYPWTKDN